MKKLSLWLCLVFLSVSALAQTAPLQQPGTITGSGSYPSYIGCFVMKVTTYGTVKFNIANSGTAWSGTIQPQTGVGQSPPSNVQVTPDGSNTPQSTITANGNYTAIVAGSDFFILCGATVTNTAAVTANAVTQVAAGGTNFAPLLQTVGLAGSTIDARISACQTKLASTGGICDARGETTPAAVAGSISITSSNITVLLPAGSITFGNGFSWTSTGNGNAIIGQGRTSSILDFSQNGTANDIVVNANGNLLQHFEVKSSFLTTGGASGSAVTFGSSQAVSDDVADDLYLLYPGSSGVAMQNCARCVMKNSFVQQSYGFGVNAGTTGNLVNRNNQVLNNTFEDCNVFIGNGCINTSGSTGSVIDLVVQGNTLRNDVYGFPTCNSGEQNGAQGIISVSGTSSGTTGTLTISAGTFPSGFIVGGLVTVTGMTPSGYNTSSAIISGGSGGTTLTYTTNGSNIGSSSVNGNITVQSTASTGCYEGLQFGKTTTNFTITGNDFNHVNSEGFIVSTGPGVVTGNTCAHCGENGAGVGAYAFGSNSLSYGIIGGVTFDGNTASDSAYCFALQYNSAAVNQTIAKVHFINNTCKKMDGYPAISYGIDLANQGPASAAVTNTVCTAGSCLVTFTTHAPIACTAGDVWSIRNASGSAGVTGASAGPSQSYNGDFVVVTPTNGGTGGTCSAFTYANGNAANTSTAGGIAYPSEFVNDIVISGNDFSDAATPLVIWAAGNVPSGFLDINGNKVNPSTVSTGQSVGSVSASESGNLVTLTSAGFPAQLANPGYVYVSGITPAGYNGQFLVLSNTGTTLTYINPISGLGASTVSGTAASLYIPGTTSETFHNVFGPVPTYSGTGSSVHRFTAGHTYNFPQVSGAITTSCSSAPLSACPILSYTLGSLQTVGLVIRWEIDSTNAAAACVAIGETQITAENTSGTMLNQITTVGGSSICTTASSLAATWSVVLNSGTLYVLVSPNVSFTPLTYVMKYDVENFSKIDPTYQTNPAAAQ